jgi:predicted transcriptional regulator
VNIAELLNSNVQKIMTSLAFARSDLQETAALNPASGIYLKISDFNIFNISAISRKLRSWRNFEVEIAKFALSKDSKAPMAPVKLDFAKKAITEWHAILKCCEVVQFCASFFEVLQGHWYVHSVGMISHDFT